jgi:hypothetical protein
MQATNLPRAWFGPEQGKYVVTAWHARAARPSNGDCDPRQRVDSGRLRATQTSTGQPIVPMVPSRGRVRLTSWSLTSGFDPYSETLKRSRIFRLFSCASDDTTWAGKEHIGPARSTAPFGWASAQPFHAERGGNVGHEC